MTKPLKAPTRTSKHSYLITEDCDFPRRSELRIPVDDEIIAEEIVEFLNQHEILGTIFGKLLIWQYQDKWGIIE